MTSPDPQGSESGPEPQAVIQAGYRYALSLTHHVQDAEDLIQQACLKILRANGQIVGKRYLFVTVRNLFLDSNRRRRETLLPQPDADALLDSTPSHVGRTDSRLDLQRLLGCLSAAQREALFLNCVEGYSASEIASLTDQPRGTVLSHLSRARRRLHERRESIERVKTS